MSDPWLITANERTIFLVKLSNVEVVEATAPYRYDAVSRSLKFSWKWPFISKIKTLTERTRPGNITLYVNGTSHIYEYNLDEIKEYHDTLEIIRKAIEVDF